jgi:hypothetical protein
LRRKSARFEPPEPGRCPGLVLLVSPSLRQSRELFGKVIGFLKRLEPVEQLEEDNKSSCTLANGARMVSLPGDPDTVRGFSAPKPIIKDEAAYISAAMCIFCGTRSTTRRVSSTMTACRRCAGFTTGAISPGRAAIWPPGSPNGREIPQAEEIKRRIHVVRNFPNGESCLRLVRALAVETHEN